jgi:arylsulfatase A-like enzyme
MNRWTFLTLVALLLAPLAALPAAEPAQPPAKPNILIILADDMGYSDLGCMGGDAETPHLDALAKTGILFPKFYNEAKCAPSRASLMTGQTCQRTGAEHKAGDVTRGGMTIAEALKGPYTTLMVGKWHIKPDPLELGFQRYFGAPLSAIHWWPTDKKEAAKIRLDGRTYTEKDMTVPVGNWFMETEHANYAIKFLQEEVVSKGKGKPFFMYYASHLPHWPLQAPRADVERYLEVFKSGTEAARQRRYQRMVELGIIDPKTCPLSPLGEKTPSWDSLSKEEKDYYQQALAIHAAMVFRLDQELGRLFDYLKKNDLFDNTAIFFMSDNGASAEGVAPIIPPGQRLGDRGTLARINDVGAAVCNTPMRGFKSSLWEGGMGTPMIFHWPQGVGQPGIISQHVGHLYDISPTVLDMAGLSYPTEYVGRKLHALDGQSLLPQLKAGAAVDRTLCWQYEKFSADLQGKWKALRQTSRGKEPSDSAWQLYDLSKDRSETKDVAQSNPEVVKTLAKIWDDWRRDVSPEGDSPKRDKAKKEKEPRKKK